MPRRAHVVEEALRRRGVEGEGEGELAGDDEREVADLWGVVGWMVVVGGEGEGEGGRRREEGGE